MSTSTVQLRLQLTGQQAQQQLQRLNLQQQQAQGQQKQNLNQILQTQNRINGSVQQGGRYGQQQLRTGQSMVQTNRLLSQLLQQQQRQSSLLSQQLRQQERSYKIQLNTLRQQVAAAERLRQQLQQAGNAQRNAGGGNFFGNTAAVVGGGVAGGMIVSNALQKPRDYDQQLTYIAATATSGQGMSTSARLAARGQLNAYVKSAIRNGGGTREDAADAVNALIASGKYDLKNVAPALNTSVKTAFATGASAIDAATLTTRMQDFGITDLQRGHDIAVRGGQLGSFEYKDQAKWLAQQMAAARATGYSGEKGFIELVAMNQVAMKTAGTADEAGNNVVNLLQKLSSSEFSKSIADAVNVQAGDPTKSDGKKKPKQIFDWTAYSIQQRDQGVYGVEAFVKLLERQLAGNAQYQKLQTQAKSTDSATRNAALEDMSNIALGSEIGGIIADRQALMAALSVVYNKDTLNDLRQQLPNSSGTVEADSSMVRQTEWAKDQAMNQEKLFAQSRAYDAVSGSLSTAKDKIVEWAQGNEDLAAAVYAGTVSVAALGAAAGIASIALGKLGGNNANLPISGSTGSKVGNIALAAGQVTLAGSLGYGVGTEIRNLYMQTETGQKFDDWGGEKIAQFLAFFGNETAKEALEANAKYEQMIAQQEQQSKEAASQSQLLQSINQNIQNLANKPQAPTYINGGSLLDVVSGSAQKESQRHGAVPFFLQRQQ